MVSTSSDNDVTAVPVEPDAVSMFVGIMSNPLADDPYPSYHALRAKAPVLTMPDGTLVLTRHADCDAALRHRALGKTDDMRGYLLTEVPAEEFTRAMALLQRSMSFANPPEHSRLRQHVSAAFTNRHVDGLRASITARVDELLDRVAAPGTDFMSTVARPLPVAILADLLGIPPADRAALTPLFSDFAKLAEPVADSAVFARATSAQDQLAEYFRKLLSDKHNHPDDDLLSRLDEAQHQGALDETEVVSQVLLLYGAGIETTTNLLGNGLFALLTHPDQMQRLRDNPDLVPSAVEEFLRYDSPVSLDARTVLEPVRFAGVDLTPGRNVTTVLAAANRDPDRFPDPDRFDIGRTDNAHLSFAAGPHFCLGAHLTRLEAQVFLERLLARTTSITLDGSPVRRPGLGLRAYASLPLTVHT